MSRRTRSAHLSIEHTHCRFERLECRHLLSFVVAEVDPSPGARLTAAPTALIVTFNHPIEPSSVYGDIQVGEVADDGSVSWLDGAIQEPGPGEERLVLTPSQVLTSGRYRIGLRNDSVLMSTDGEALDVEVTDEEFRALGDFWIEEEGVGHDDAIDLGTPGPIPTPVGDALDFGANPRGIRLVDAIDLGTPGPIPTSVGGALDFGANPHDVRLYKITLPAGHFWRLGLEVTSQRDGGTLDSALALFDADGRPIAASDEGRQDALHDPYLFIGLSAGTYYIGVSGAGDLPGTPGGYDPVSATPGSVAQASAGGPFTLHLVADPADTPITLLGMDLDEHDSRDSTPTGFTLQFSGAIRFDSLSRSIEVVDQGGRTWPVVASHYLESEARISFLFRDRLPEGYYVVRLPEQGGLVDLAGLSPIAPGQPPPVLGTFSVGPRAAMEDPHDLGALLPGPGAVAGLSGRASLAPGQSVTYRVVITFPHRYSFQSRYTGGPLAISRNDPDGTVPLNPGEPDLWNARNLMFLVPGEYFFQLTAVGSRPVDVEFLLKGPFNLEELTLANGVGQGPALSLRLIAPIGPVPNPRTRVPHPPPDGPPQSRGLSPPAPPSPPTLPDRPQGASPPAPPSSPTLPDRPQGASPPAPPSSPTLPDQPVGPMPTQPGQGRDESTPLLPGPSPSPGVGAVASSPAATFANQVSPVLVPGFVSDLIGRPSPEVPLTGEFDPGSELGGTASAPGNLGLLQQFGHERGLSNRFGPRGIPPADGLPPPEADVFPAVPIPSKGVAIMKESDWASQEPMPIIADLPRLLSSVVRSWVEAWLKEGHHDDGGDVDPSAPAQIATSEAVSSPEALQQSSLISNASIGLATAIGLVMFLIPHPRRWISRIRSGHARNVGLAVRPGSPATTGRRRGLP